MYIVRTFNPCFKNVSNTIISVQNLKDLKNKVTFANIVFMSSGQYSPDIDVINSWIGTFGAYMHQSLVSLWKEHNRRSKSGWRWLTHHPPYVYFIDWTLDQEEELEEYGATLDLGLSHFNSLRQQTALTTTVSTKKASPSDYSYTYSTTSSVVWLVAKKKESNRRSRLSLVSVPS